MQVQTIETESLGNRGYLVHDGRVGVAIDVQRDFERWLGAAKEAHVTITHVFETHMHNDYITGGYQLAETSGATYVVPGKSGTSLIALELGDGDKVVTGKLKVTGLHTPGHTEHHMSFLVEDSVTSAVFTGGGILYGTVGRTDLVGKDKTDMLTHAQYDSAQRLGNTLHDDVAVFPTHGFGSFCSSAAGSGATESTIAEEKRTNVVFTAKDRESFVQTIVSGLGPYPRYYAHMGAINQKGPEAVRQLHIHSYSSDQVSDKLKSGDSWVIDTRSRTLFANNHPEGAVGIELGKSFATYTGWIIPWDSSMLLVGDTEQELKDAYVELSRIGMDQFVSGATDSVDNYLVAGKKSTYQVTDFKHLEEHMSEKPFVLDVRFATDWQASHIVGSVNIPLHELLDRMKEVPKARPIWVHCASGYRASIAASLLDKSGRSPVLINDNFKNATLTTEHSRTKLT